MSTLRLGARRSPLAQAQAVAVADGLRAHGCQVEIVGLSSVGDRTSGPLSEIGGTGVFVAEVRDALLGDEIDLAVHSLKDLPTAPTEGLVVAAVPVREDPRDALCTASRAGLAGLTDGATVGTSSPRRAAQLRKLGPRLHISDIRGNVDTRLARVAAGDFDAIVLASAGLRRLDRADAITEELDPDVMLPAPGQGALAVECRADATFPGTGGLLADLLATVLDDPSSRACVSAERTVLAELEAGCSAPVGALARIVGSGPDARLVLQVGVFATDGSAAVTTTASGSPAAAADLGRRVAATLLADGAADLMPRSDANPRSSDQILPEHRPRVESPRDPLPPTAAETPVGPPADANESQRRSS